MMSLTPTGRPCERADALALALRVASAALASSSARSRSRWAQACTSASRSSMRARQAATSSSEVMRAAGELSGGLGGGEHRKVGVGQRSRLSDVELAEAAQEPARIMVKESATMPVSSTAM